MHRAVTLAVCSSETGIHQVILWRKCFENVLCKPERHWRTCWIFSWESQKHLVVGKKNSSAFAYFFLQFLLLTVSSVYLWMRHIWQIQLEALDVSTTQHCSDVCVSVQSTHIETEKRHWLGVCYQVTWPYRGFSPAGSDRQVFLSRALPDLVSRAAA